MRKKYEAPRIVRTFELLPLQRAMLEAASLSDAEREQALRAVLQDLDKQRTEAQ